MILDRWHKRLNQKDIGLPTIGVQLHLNAIVAEAVDRAAAEGHAQILAYMLCQLTMCVPAKDHNIAHCELLSREWSRVIWTSIRLDQSTKLP